METGLDFVADELRKAKPRGRSKEAPGRAKRAGTGIFTRLAIECGAFVDGGHRRGYRNVQVSVVGHVTADEFRRYFRAIEAANGFGNRFLLAYVKRSKVLPFGGQLQAADMFPVRHALDDVIRVVEALDSDGAEVTLGPDARYLWASVYPRLSDAKPGILGALTARAEAHALRIAALYAVLDKTLVVHRAHLDAALEVVRYAEDSTRYVFGDASGDAMADDILAALRARPNGITRTELRDYFGRNRTGDDIGRALDLLAGAGLARATVIETTGRPAERWLALEPRASATTETTETTDAVSSAAPGAASVANVVSVVPRSIEPTGLAR